MNDVFPLETQDLYLQFANLNLTPPAILAFANQHGFLGVSGYEVIAEFLDYRSVEPLFEWFTQITHMKTGVDLLQMAQENDVPRLALRIVHGRQMSNKIKDEDLESDPYPDEFKQQLETLFSGRLFLADEQRMPYLFQGNPLALKLSEFFHIPDAELKKFQSFSKWLPTFARAFAHQLAAHHLERSKVTLQNLWNSETYRSTARVVPEGLLAAMWLQFQRTLENNKPLRSCPACGNFFAIGIRNPNQSRATRDNKITCGNQNCRQVLSRWREEIIPWLRTTSKTRIAKKLNLEPTLVSYLIESSKRRTKTKKRKEA